MLSSCVCLVCMHHLDTHQGDSTLTSAAVLSCQHVCRDVKSDRTETWQNSDLALRWLTLITRMLWLAR